MRKVVRGWIVIIIGLLTWNLSEAIAQDGKATFTSKAPFAQVAAALQQAIAGEKMGLVCHANAQAGAAARGVKIPGNQVLMLFRPDFAIRMLKASVEAGFEAPIRIYIYENPDGTATIMYRKPSAVFGPYSHGELDAIGAELDPIFERVVAQALAVR